MLTDSNKFKRLCEIGNAIALKNSHMTQCHSALIISGGSIISTGVNSFDRCKFDHKYTPGCHAEVNALMRIPKKIRRNNLQMIVFHPGKDKFHPNKPSKPCSFCMKFIREWGIDRIYYICPSTREWVCRRTRDMNEIYFSSFVRNMGMDIFN